MSQRYVSRRRFHLADDSVVAFAFYNIDGLVAGMTKDTFEEVLRDIDLSHLVIKALPPYVAIVDATYWEVLDCIKCKKLCSLDSNFAMKVLLQHKKSGTRLGVANCHIPSTTASDKRKKDTIDTLCTQLATLDNLPSWIIGGDLQP